MVKWWRILRAGRYPYAACHSKNSHSGLKQNSPPRAQKQNEGKTQNPKTEIGEMGSHKLGNRDTPVARNPLFIFSLLFPANHVSNETLRSLISDVRGNRVVKSDKHVLDQMFDAFLLLFPIRHEAGEHPVKLRTVVGMLEVADLVGDHVVDAPGWHVNEFRIERDPPVW
jgi:hypothetical protein